MFFKRLELHGFKSFGHKQAIDFLPGVTIVVGPNGCGKSNVLDGIRWVLGETSAKSLRGGRMGDVVFRGTQSVKSSGLAQVTLLCDNSGHTLKVDQSEIAVTRRLFSNGDSEYLTNKQTCRMRDIHELFMDTGLGADGYSIIEQGRIGEIVSAKPDQRREIFEEAAGISLYKARREETLRKLLRTEEDLVRLYDIVGEVETSCNSLRRQAKKAERHQRLKRRLQRLQQRLMILRHEALTIQIRAVEEKLTIARDEFEKASAQLATAETAQTQAQLETEEAARKLQELQQFRHALQSELERERHRGEMATQRTKALDERQALIERELESSTSRASILASTLGALEIDYKAQEQALTDRERELGEAQRRYESLRRETEAAGHQTHRLRAELTTIRQKESALQNDRRVAETLVARLTDDLDATEFQERDLSSAATQLDREVSTARIRVESGKVTLAELQAEARAVAAEIGEHDKNKGELSRRLEVLTREMHQANSRLQALQELEENFEGYFRGVKEVMQASTRGQLGGIVGVVSNLLGVPKNLEIAMEVALGSDLQDIVTKGVDDAKRAIQFLKDRNFGRATFLPLDFLHSDFRTDHIDRILGRPGVLGLARNLVEFEQSLTPAVHYLFGSTVLVETLDIAIGLEREGVRTRYVSLAGDVVNPRGVLSGGSHQTRGLLSRHREIKVLKETVAKLDSELAAAKSELQSAKDRLGALYARSAELQTTVHRAQIDETRAEKDLQQAETQFRERRTQLAQVQSRAAQQRTDRLRHQETIATASKALSELADKAAALEHSLATEEEGALERSRRLQEASELVAATRGETAALRERVNALRTRLKEVRESMEQSARDRDRGEAERLALDNERGILALEHEEAENRTVELSRKRDEIDGRISAAMTDHTTRSAEVRRLTTDLQSHLRDRNVRDNSLREIEVQSAQLTAQIDYLKREAEDEFALEIADIAKALAEAEAADTLRRQELEAARVALKEKRARDRKASREEQSTEPPSAEEAPAVEEDEDEEADLVTMEEDRLITDTTELRGLVQQMRDQLTRMGAVNEAAIEEYATQKTRLDFLKKQRDDLTAAKDTLTETIGNIDETTKNLFSVAFEKIRANFVEMFRRMFNGGKADLLLIEQEGQPEPGIEIFAQPPGKNIGGSLSLMSGGEKALTAVALMFALFQFKPSPICILDEIDAPLDDVNVGRFCDVVRDFSRETQFLIITHNKITMGLADTIYGVTMQEPGISKVVSVKFDQVEQSGLLEAPAAG